ncbi:hypothetical protein FQA39_LY10679 [Lamprigera yunnana]|nr:hypothetical protein FQA39_LY10679 [Lamprigera yunnana]
MTKLNPPHDPDTLGTVPHDLVTSLSSCIVVNNFIKTMDSIPTSCIQLAKEQIIKYSDPKYNINDLKTGDCETMLLNQTIYYLNKSKSKWISVGLYYPFEFASVVKIFGRSKQYVIFKEEEWIQFHEQRENINKYFQTCDMMWKPRQIGSKTLTFEMIEEKKILKIEDMSGNEVYLGWESVSEVWSLESVLRYRLSYSSGSNLKYFYEDVIKAVAEMSGDVKLNIYNIINRLSEKSDDVYCMLEVPLFMPKKALFDVQLERRIQEQGQKRVKKHLLKKIWMLYAQEHWTKSYDLKSAVERLYEELGALEFDADHEAIYGMERYYTVQQCEELRDKYKIGRKFMETLIERRLSLLLRTGKIIKSIIMSTQSIDEGVAAGPGDELLQRTNLSLQLAALLQNITLQNTEMTNSITSQIYQIEQYLRKTIEENKVGDIKMIKQSEIKIEQNIEAHIQPIETKTKTLEEGSYEMRIYAEYDRNCFSKNFKQANNSVKCLNTTVTSLDREVKEIANETVNLENKLGKTGNACYVQRINPVMLIAENKPIFDGSSQSLRPIRFIPKL